MSPSNLAIRIVTAAVSDVHTTLKPTKTVGVCVPRTRRGTPNVEEALEGAAYSGSDKKSGHCEPDSQLLVTRTIAGAGHWVAWDKCDLVTRTTTAGRRRRGRPAPSSPGHEAQSSGPAPTLSGSFSSQTSTLRPMPRRRSVHQKDQCRPPIMAPVYPHPLEGSTSSTRHRQYPYTGCRCGGATESGYASPTDESCGARLRRLPQSPAPSSYTRSAAADGPQCRPHQHMLALMRER